MTRLVEHPSDLTPEQRLHLGTIRSYLETPPTVGSLYARSARAIIVLLVIFGGLAWVSLELDSPAGALFACGMVAGVLLRDLTMFRRAVRLWPATGAVVDPAAIERLLGDPAPDPREWE